MDPLPQNTNTLENLIDLGFLDPGMLFLKDDPLKTHMPAPPTPDHSLLTLSHAFSPWNSDSYNLPQSSAMDTPGGIDDQDFAAFVRSGEDVEQIELPELEFDPPQPIGPVDPAVATLVPDQKTRHRTHKRRNGFRRSDAPLLTEDAPIQPRNYTVPSRTSRKQVPIAIVRELNKRKHADEERQSRNSTPASEACETPAKSADDNIDITSIPKDLLTAADRKRHQNTISARRSRLRKQALLGELTTENEALKSENEALKSENAILSLKNAQLDQSNSEIISQNIAYSTRIGVLEARLREFGISTFSPV